jgi:hypothetical protein
VSKNILLLLKVKKYKLMLSIFINYIVIDMLSSSVVNKKN